MLTNVSGRGLNALLRKSINLALVAQRSFWSSQTQKLEIEICQQILVWSTLLLSTPVWATPITVSTRHIHQDIDNFIASDVVPQSPKSQAVVETAHSTGNHLQKRSPTHPQFTAAALTPVTVQPLNGQSLPELNPSFTTSEELKLSQPAGSWEPTDLLPQQQPSPTPATGDPELGNLRLQELAAPSPQSEPTVYLLNRINFFKSNNILSGVDPVDDNLGQVGIALWAGPKLGPDTYLIASVEGSVNRYFNLSQFNYNELQFELGLYQQLTPEMYGEIGWRNQQLFATETGDRFLNDHALQLEIGRRDPLAERLNLNTFYQLRFSFADPGERSRIIHNLGVSLNYDIQTDLQTALEYQFIMSDFTQQDRSDVYNQLILQLTYRLTPESRISLFGGFSFGGSSNPNLNFDSSLLGVSFNLSLPLF